MPVGILKICARGHRYYKSSDCPTCPVCEEERKPDDGFLSHFAAPARRALEREGLYSLKQVSTLTEAQLLTLHGFGQSSVKKIRTLLKRAGLRFRVVN